MPGATDAAEPDDASLVAAARRGERTAFGALYRRHARLVQAVLLARVAPDSVADLVQDVFLLAMGRIGSLRDGGAFAPWVATIARRTGAGGATTPCRSRTTRSPWRSARRARTMRRQP